MPSLAHISVHLDRVLRVDAHPAERNGVLRPSDRTVRRIGLALDLRQAAALPGLGVLDALVLHRWWGHETLDIPTSAGVLGYHLPFDDRMTLGDNPWLASTLGMLNVRSVHMAAGRAIGMVGDVPEGRTAAWFDTVEHTFGGCEMRTLPGDFEQRDAVRRVAVVGAMTDALVRECHERGAELFITGQFREPARQAVSDTGIAVIAVGHARSEMWGVRCLATELRKQWSDLDVTHL